MPNSLLWVCLVAIWLFVLVPMVVKSRPTVRKTSDAALATRVLHRGGRTIAKTKRRMASGRHPHDAEWEPPVREYRKVVAKSGTATAVKEPKVDVAEVDEDVVEAPVVEKKPVMKKVAVEADSTSDVVDDELTDDADTDIEAVVDDEADGDDIETAEAGEDDSAAEVDDDLEAEVDEDSEEAELEDSEFDEAELEDAEYDDEDDEFEDDAEYDDHEDVDTADEKVAQGIQARRAHRGGFDPEADRERSNKRYRFRQRVMAGLGVLAFVSVLAGFVIGAAGWALAVVVIAGLVGYMSFLRRAVRNEQRIYQQRMRRLARARREEETHRAQPEVDPRADIPARLRRPGAIVLEIDDEDPIFDHLPRYVPATRLDTMDRHDSYRRVVGQ